MTKIAIYPGTFDPITYGHIDVIKKGLKLFNKIIVAVSDVDNKDYLFEICRIKNISIKKLIMDQKVVVGVGNIYASESLFLAKIKPNKLSKTISLKECDQLTNAIKRVLRYAIRMGGTTLKDFYSADGSEGYFNLNLNVYDREDENCKNCKSKIKKVTIGQRASFFCDSCQN